MHGQQNVKKYRILSIARREKRCFSSSKHPNGFRVQPASYSLYIDSSYSEVWRLPSEADTHLRLVPQLRITGDITPLPHMLS